MDNQKLKKYKNPIDFSTGNRYFVPCVVKSKDSLIYYILGVNHCAVSILKQMPETSAIKTDLRLHSLRFNDILPDGKKIHQLTKKDFADMERENEEREKDKHPDNIIKQELCFFSINCPNCGNYYEFNNPEEIPNENFFCGLCERVLIDYTGIDDWDFEYYEA